MSLWEQPIGPGNGVFTIEDLLHTEKEFPGAMAYFGNSSDTILCIEPAGNPTLQWCSYKPSPWTYGLDYTPSPCHTDPVVAEPNALCFLLLAFAFVVLWTKIKKKLTYLEKDIDYVS